MMRIRRRLVAIAVGALVGSGCNCSTTHVTKVSPALGDVPDSLDFGLVAVGDSGTQLLTLTAESSADLTLDAHVEDASGPFQIAPAPPSTIPGDGQVVLTLLYSPTKVGTDAGTLVINTDDPNHARGDRRVLLSGQGESPQIEVTPDQITMPATACPTGASSATCSDSASFSIKNVGQVRLKLGTVDLEPQDPTQPIPPAAQLGIAPLVSTATMTPGQTVTSQVVWKPLPALLTGSGAETFKANLVVPSNDPAHPKIKVPVVVTANPNLPPQACLAVAKVMQTVYVYNSQTGETTPQQKTLPAQDYDCGQNPTLNCPAGQVAVRPGAVVYLSSEGTDPTTGKPCTFDPEGGVLSYTWSTDFAPDPSATQVTSRAEVTPDVPPSTGTLQLDAVGTYTVHLLVKDNLGQPATASVVVNGVPRDDLSVQLSWQGQQYQGADLDLHLLVDAPAPYVTVPAVMFCNQDCFWANPSPVVFGQWHGGAFEAIPHQLRDDQGTSGQLESTSLISAPPGAKFRVAVDLWNPGPVSGGITPTLDVWLKNRAVHQTLSPSVALQGQDDVWVAAQVDFPTDPTAVPTLTTLDQHLKPVTDQNDPTQVDASGSALPGYYWSFGDLQDTVGACR